MKKMMTVAAAALCAAVGFADGLTSDNVVGYQGKNIVNNEYNFMVATFEKIDGSVPTLADITVNDEYALSTLSFLKPDTAGTKRFDVPGVGEGVASEFCYYFAADLEGTAYEGQPGWYYVDDSANLYPMNNIEIPYGSMFYMQGLDEGNPQIVFNGQVGTKDVSISIVNNMYNFTGNCTPVDLTLADIGVNEDYSLSTLSFLKPDTAGTKRFDVPGVGEGVASEFCYYFAADLEGTAYEGQPGWYYVDDSANLYPMNNIPIPAGSMFYLQGLDEGSPAVIIPAAL